MTDEFVDIEEVQAVAAEMAIRWAETLNILSAKENDS